jgi:hypothetical protein
MPDSVKPVKPLLRRIISRYRGIIAAVLHLVLFGVAFFGAFGLYYNFKYLHLWFEPFYVPLLPIVVAIKMAVFWWLRLFRGSWRYVGMRDMLAVVKATNISTFGFVFVFLRGRERTPAAVRGEYVPRPGHRSGRPVGGDPVPPVYFHS